MLPKDLHIIALALTKISSANKIRHELEKIPFLLFGHKVHSFLVLMQKNYEFDLLTSTPVLLNFKGRDFGSRDPGDEERAFLCWGHGVKSNF